MKHKITYKYINLNEVFEFEGQKYIKTNFQRGYYLKDGRKVFKRFKKTDLVSANHKEFDI